jgi:hypothetical protein
MSSLCQRLSSEGELLTFSDTEPIQALQAILERRPRLIVLERLFAATPRGAALINRIKTDPTLGDSEVRVMSHTGDYMRQVTPAGSGPSAGPGGAGKTEVGGAGLAVASQAPAASAEQPARPLDWQGTRRAPRFRMKTGVEIQLDGNAAAVVDVSTAGAQVLSSTILRPNQKVRVSIAQDDTFTRCRGTVAWAKFELPKASGAPVYRAGVEFLDADAVVVDQFTARNRQ